MSEPARILVRGIRDSELLAVADIHCQAFHGYVNVLLGRGYIRAFLRWFMVHPGCIALSASMADGTPLGYVVGGCVGYSGALSRDLAMTVFLGYCRAPLLIFDRRFRRTLWRRVQSLMGRKAVVSVPVPRLAEPVMSLVAIGVAGAATGKGVGRALMNAFEEESRRLGVGSMRLSVYPGNAAARRVYENAGWTAHELPDDPNDAMYYSKSLGGDASVHA
jgi:GNAT superfamily N-acetyltransferase